MRCSQAVLFWVFGGRVRVVIHGCRVRDVAIMEFWLASASDSFCLCWIGSVGANVVEVCVLDVGIDGG